MNCCAFAPRCTMMAYRLCARMYAHPPKLTHMHLSSVHPPSHIACRTHTHAQMHSICLCFMCASVLPLTLHVATPALLAVKCDTVARAVGLDVRARDNDDHTVAVKLTRVWFLLQVLLISVSRECCNYSDTVLSCYKIMHKGTKLTPHL